jgi:hypothetical protein
MFDLMIGADAVQRRTKRAFETQVQRSPKRRVAGVRLGAAAGLRALADRIEPVGAGGAPEVAGAHPR